LSHWSGKPVVLRIGALLLAVVGTLYGLHLAGWMQSDALAPPTPRQTSPVAAAGSFGAVGSPPPGVVETARYVDVTLGRGGTLAGALGRVGLPSADQHRVALELARELDLRRLSPSTGLRAALDRDGAIRSIAVRADRTRFVRWSDAGEASRIEVVDLPLRTRVEDGGGRVVYSVHQALEELPWANELTLAFADIFQWDVDLLVDPRTGDRVHVVYELEILGRLPEDLPPFGQAPDATGEPLRLGRVLAATYEGRLARAAAYWVEGPDGDGGYYDETGMPMRKTFLKSPLNYRRISSGFSNARRNPVTRKVVPHHGVDFAAAPGTPVVAAADGRVVTAAWQGALGRAVRVRHGSEYTTVYGHLRGFARGIRAGVEVKQNQVIGYVGSTGRATGPHLHYTLIHRDRAVDPLKFRNPPSEPLPAARRPSLERAILAWSPLLGRNPLTLAGVEPGGPDTARRGI